MELPHPSTGPAPVDGIQATRAALGALNGAALASDGSLYIVDNAHSLVGGAFNSVAPA